MSKSGYLKIFFVFIILLYFFFLFNPILLNRDENLLVNESSIIHKKGDTIKPFYDFNFDSGNWKVCVLIKERLEVSSNIQYGKYLFTEDMEVIKRFKHLQFEYSRGDMATVQNEIIFYHNNKIVFRGNVVLDKFNEGIQNEKFGWISSEKLKMSIIIKDFELKLIPFVSI